MKVNLKLALNNPCKTTNGIKPVSKNEAVETKKSFKDLVIPVTFIAIPITMLLKYLLFTQDS